jgi:hypothetical protein
MKGSGAGKKIRAQATLVERLKTASSKPPPVGRDSFSQPSGTLPIYVTQPLG